MNAAARTGYYAEATGLSRAKVNQYRKQPVSNWTTTADRKIGSTIRAAERLAQEPEITWDQWMEKTGQILSVVRAWISGAMDKVAHFVERIGRVARDVLNALSKVLKYAARIAAILAPLLTAAG